jgi:hypothetical protein
MTEPTLTVPDLSDDENRTLNFLVEQLAKKSKRNGIRSVYYDSRRAVKKVSAIIPPQYANLALTLGWAAKGVDGLARRCNLEEFVWADGDLAALGIQELEDSNFLTSEIAQARTDALIHGVAYLINTQGDVDDDEPKSLIHAKDALNATGEWNDRKRRLDNLLSVTARKDNQIVGFVLYLDGETINADKVNGKWETSRSEHPWHVPVDPLVYHPRTSKRMGKSRINRPVMSIQDSAIRSLVRLEAHMDIYAIPKLILLGASEGIFKNADGTAKSSWQVVMGRIFGIPDADQDGDSDQKTPRADVKQFSAESPAPHLSQLNALAKLMARELDMSDADFALTDMANPTAADAYSEARENLVAEAEDFTDDMSVPIRRVITRGLAIQNGEDTIPESWRSIVPKWRSPMYVSKSAAADAGQKQLAAIPWLAETKVGLELIGLTPLQIQEAQAERRLQAGRAVITALQQKPAGPVAVPNDNADVA